MRICRAEEGKGEIEKYWGGGRRVGHFERNGVGGRTKDAYVGLP